MQIYVMACRPRVMQTKVAEVRVYGTLLLKISQVVLSHFLCACPCCYDKDEGERAKESYPMAGSGSLN
jgi:hypothetical protein